ncbi:hypothetical protein ACIQNG_05735 [Streptomyces sp. NPDC091377]|uniref:hypothetical protein n=1 Tax=Streptomyces sp. NPDC091377 TaxID=3365995 RepID=UPI0037F16F3D
MSESTTGVTGVTSQYAAKVTEDLEHNLNEQQRIASDITALQSQLGALRDDHVVLTNLQQALGVNEAAAGEPVEEAGAKAEETGTKAAETGAEAEEKEAEAAAVVPAPRKKQAAKGKPEAAATKSAAKPKTVTKTATKTATKAAAKPAAKSVAKPAAKPAAKSAAKAPAPASKAQTTAAKPKAEAAVAKSEAGGKKKAAVPAARKAAAKPSAPADASAQPTLVQLIREHLAGQQEPRSAAEVATALTEQHPDRTVKTTVVRTTLEGLVAKSLAQRSKQGTSVFYSGTSADAKPAAVEGQ